MNTSISRHKSTYAYGKERKRLIKETIEKGIAITSTQIRTMFFSELKPKSAIRKCQEILREMVDAKEINCMHYSKLQFLPSVYFINKKPENWRHHVAVNEVLCGFIRQKPQLFKLEWKWTYSIYDGLVFPDIMMNIWYDPDGKKKQIIMVEVESNPRKRFDKDKQYQKVFDKDWHIDLPEWVIVEDKKAIFPTVLIVTDKEIELRETDVKFKIASPEEVAEDVYKLIWKK